MGMVTARSVQIIRSGTPRLAREAARLSRITAVIHALEEGSVTVERHRADALKEGL
jgi:hypothetical protein